LLVSPAEWSYLISASRITLSYHSVKGLSMSLGRFLTQLDVYWDSCSSSVVNNTGLTVVEDESGILTEDTLSVSSNAGSSLIDIKYQTIEGPGFGEIQVSCFFPARFCLKHNFLWLSSFWSENRSAWTENALRISTAHLLMFASRQFSCSLCTTELFELRIVLFLPGNKKPSQLWWIQSFNLRFRFFLDIKKTQKPGLAHQRFSSLKWWSEGFVI